MNQKIIQDLQRKFEKYKKDYSWNETWSGSQGFVKDVFSKFLWLKERTQYKNYDRNTFIQETKIVTGNNVRADFILNIQGIKVVVEVEKRDNIKPGIEQIERYMREEGTPYGILTDSENWYFYSKGFDFSQWEFWGGVYKKLDELLHEQGKTFIAQFFSTKDYYINFFNRIDIESFFFHEDTLQKDLKNFHKELIQIAEKLKSDFEKSGVFWEISDKELIQTTYSFIIQFLLIKIIQDKKKNLELINKQNFVNLLQWENYNGLANSIFEQIDWLGKFYTSYQNEQKHLIEKISEHYKNGAFGMSLDFEAVQGFLDLYVFVYKFNFKNIKQDIFGAVYENYLKELYKDDNSKKWQVFTPPEIVEFMLDEIGYTSEYISWVIEKYIEKVWYQDFRQDLIKNKEIVEFNIGWLSLIDPACGSGTFLYKAAGRIVNSIIQVYNKNSEFKNDKNKELPWILSENLIVNNLVGFDIEAFPLYLAEMNILQSLLWFNIDEQSGEVLNKIDKSIKVFSTDDTISEFANMQDNIEEILEDFDREWQIFSVNKKRVPKDISELKIDIIDGGLEAMFQKYIVNYFAKRLYTKDKKIQSKLTSFSNQEELENYIKEKWDDFMRISYFWKTGNTKDGNKDGLKKQSFEMIERLEKLVAKHKTKRTKFDFVIANPPYVYLDAGKKEIFGISINDANYTTIETKYKSYSEGLPYSYQKPNLTTSKFNLYGYFYYLAYYLLKDDGKLCFINPRSLINRFSFYKLKIFLKETGSIKKIYDFKNAALFHGRWINSWVVVGTDSLILLYEKNHSQKNVEIFEYTWNEKLITLQDFQKQNKKYDVEYKKLFSSPLEVDFIFFIDYLYEIQKQDHDFHYSILPWISIWRKKDLSNNEKKWYPIFHQHSYYTNINDISRYYDPSENGYEKVRPTCLWILEKNYRIVLNYFNRANLVSFSDFKWIQNWWNWIGIWVDKIENVWELKYIFWVLNSSFVKKFLFENFDNIWTLTALKLMPFPKIDSELKQKLKAKLIKNGEEIIALCKNGTNTKLRYRDIVETRISGMDEEIVGLKNEYKSLEIDLENIDLDAEIPEDILKNSSQKSLAELERERDLLVYCLYFGSESWEKDMIDLRKINIENIFESETMICENENVQVVEEK